MASFHSTSPLPRPAPAGYYADRSGICRECRSNKANNNAEYSFCDVCTGSQGQGELWSSMLASHTMCKPCGWAGLGSAEQSLSNGAACLQLRAHALACLGCLGCHRRRCTCKGPTPAEAGASCPALACRCQLAPSIKPLAAQRVFGAQSWRPTVHTISLLPCSVHQVLASRGVQAGSEGPLTLRALRSHHRLWRGARLSSAGCCRSTSATSTT